MDKMLDSDSTQASSLFHSQDHVAYFPAFQIVLLFLLQRGCSLKPFAFWNFSSQMLWPSGFLSLVPRRFFKFLHFPSRSWMSGPDHCCSRLRVHLPRHWNFRLNFQPSSIQSLNQLELVRMDIPLSSCFQFY